MQTWGKLDFVHFGSYLQRNLTYAWVASTYLPLRFESRKYLNERWSLQAGRFRLLLNRDFRLWDQQLSRNSRKNGIVWKVYYNDVLTSRNDRLVLEIPCIFSKRYLDARMHFIYTLLCKTPFLGRSKAGHYKCSLLHSRRGLSMNRDKAMRLNSSNAYTRPLKKTYHIENLLNTWWLGRTRCNSLKWYSIWN